MTTKSVALHRAESASPQIGARLLRALPLILMILLLIIMLFPLVMVIINSFKTEPEYYAGGPFALPQSLNFSTIVETWQHTDYTTKLINSVYISISVAVLGTGLSLLNAFALGIGRVRGRTARLIFFLLAITLPPESLAYPLYYFFKQVKLYDTQISVILVTTAFNSAYGTYLLTSVFSSFNRELLEAALIDGCNKVKVLTLIVVPLSWPSLSVLFVFFFIWTWNDFFLPLILLVSNSRQTVPVAIAMAQGEHNAVITTQSAAALLGILPCLIFFFLFQRTMTRGITAGSLK